MNLKESLPTQATKQATSGAITSTACWVVGLVISPAAADGSVILKNGGSGGTELLNIATKGHATPTSFYVPIGGYMEFGTDCYATLSNAGVTVLYYQGI